MLESDEFLGRFHHALLELHLEEGALVCLETGRCFPVNKGFPNMLLHEDKLNVNAILSILVSSFTGFGITISMNSLLMEYVRWRTSRQIQSSNQNINRTQQQRRDHVQQEQEDQGLHHQQ